jgi:hypothetical protein
LKAEWDHIYFDVEPAEQNFFPFESGLRKPKDLGKTHVQIILLESVKLKSADTSKVTESGAWSKTAPPVAVRDSEKDLLGAEWGRATSRLPGGDLTNSATRTKDQLLGGEWAKPLNNLLGGEWAKPSNSLLGGEWAKSSNNLLGGEWAKPSNNLLGAEWAKPSNSLLGAEWAKSSGTLLGGEWAKPSNSLLGGEWATSHRQASEKPVSDEPSSCVRGKTPAIPVASPRKTQLGSLGYVMEPWKESTVLQRSLLGGEWSRA